MEKNQWGKRRRKKKRCEIEEKEYEEEMGVCM